MFEEIKSFLKELMSSWQIARIYEIKHPRFLASIEQAYKNLQVVLHKNNELTVGIFGEELASGKHIFFDLSKRVASSIADIKKRGIERIIFRKGVAKEELIKFISLLLIPAEETKSLLQDLLRKEGVAHIEVDKLKGKTLSLQAEERQLVNRVACPLSAEDNCLSKVSQSVDILLDENIVDALSLKFTVNNIVEYLMGNYRLFSDLVLTKGHDVVTFTHLLNVSSLSMQLSHSLGFSREDSMSISIAGMFHDIGKLYIKKKILQKPGKLKNEEFCEMKSHTVLGSEILLKHVEALTILPSVVAFEHHLGYDCSGYPKGSFLKKPHIASLIVMVCDVYDALTQRRSYKSDYPSEVIYEIMLNERGKKIFPPIFDKFFQIIGVWPKGTIVSLNNGKIAIVRKINEDNIFSPQVELVEESSQKMIDLKIDKRFKIKRSLNPFSEGKQYADLI